MISAELINAIRTTFAPDATDEDIIAAALAAFIVAAEAIMQYREEPIAIDNQFFSDLSDYVQAGAFADSIIKNSGDFKDGTNTTNETDAPSEERAQSESDSELK